MEYEECRESIRRLQQSVLRGEPAPAEEIVGAVEAYSSSLVTNAESAAYHLFGAIAPFCALRPELEDRLLEIPVWALMNHLYDTAERAAAWLRHQLEREGERAFDNPGAESRAWLERLSGQPGRLQPVFDRIAAEVTDENTRAVLDELMPHSVLPRERVEVRWEWTEGLLRECERLVLFFLSPRVEENQAAFRALTGALARCDPEGRIGLRVLDLPPFLRPAEFRHPEMADRWFDVGQEEPQTFWVYRGRPLASIGRGVADPALYASGAAALTSRDEPG